MTIDLRNNPSYHNPVTGVLYVWDAAVGAYVVVSGLGSSSYTVGVGGNYDMINGIQQAITDIGSTITLHFAEVNSVTATNGSPIVTGSGTLWRTGAAGTSGNQVSPSIPYTPGQKIRVGDLWKHVGDTQYYKIKSVESDTQFTLMENYVGTTHSAAGSGYYYLNRQTIILLPGLHWAFAVPLIPGVDFVALDKYRTMVSEDITAVGNLSSNPVVFMNVSENSFHNIRFGSRIEWGDFDGLMLSNPAPWAGAVNTIDGCHIKQWDPQAAHQGGALSLPALVNGTLNVINTQVENAKNPNITFGPNATAGSAASTFVNIDNCQFGIVLDADSKATSSDAFPGGLNIGANNGIAIACTANINNSRVWCPDQAIVPSSGHVIGFKVQQGTGGSVTANFVNCSVDIANTSGTAANTYAFLNLGGTANIRNCSLKAAGTGATGVVTNNASAVTNLTLCSIDATTGITNTAGTTNSTLRGNVVNGAVV